MGLFLLLDYLYIVCILLYICIFVFELLYVFAEQFVLLVLFEVYIYIYMIIIFEVSQCNYCWMAATVVTSFIYRLMVKNIM